MNEVQVHRWMCYAFFALGVFTFVLLFFHTVGYGRHRRARGQRFLSNRASWIWMEIPTIVLLAVLIWLGDESDNPVTWVFVAIWLCHYGYRTFIYPFRLVYVAQRMPVGIVAAGFIFQFCNTFLIWRWITHLHHYDAQWLLDWRFLVGMMLFIVAIAGNLWSDEILLRLKRSSPESYQIPQGGLFRWVSSPNYLCEILEWCSFALLTWSLPGLAFAAYTIANLVPRALANHRWYHEKFPSYPADRKALLPGLW